MKPPVHPNESMVCEDLKLAPNWVRFKHAPTILTHVKWPLIPDPFFSMVPNFLRINEASAELTAPKGPCHGARQFATNQSSRFNGAKLENEQKSTALEKTEQALSSLPLWARALTASIPVAGSSMSVLIEGLIGNFHRKRIEEFEARLIYLENSGRLENSVDQKLVETALQLTLTSEHLFRSIGFASISHSTEYSETGISKRILYLDILNRLSITDMVVLLNIHNRNMEQDRQIILEKIPGLTEEEILLDKDLEEFSRYRLLNNRIIDQNQGVFTTTRIGKQLLWAFS